MLTEIHEIFVYCRIHLEKWRYFLFFFPFVEGVQISFWFFWDPNLCKSYLYSRMTRSVLCSVVLGGKNRRRACGLWWKCFCGWKESLEVGIFIHLMNFECKLNWIHVNDCRYSTFVNWELWWPSFPILVYFKETQTKPEGQVHFFPVIFVSSNCCKWGFAEENILSSLKEFGWWEVLLTNCKFPSMIRMESNCTMSWWKELALPKRVDQKNPKERTFFQQTWSGTYWSS